MPPPLGQCVGCNVMGEIRHPRLGIFADGSITPDSHELTSIGPYCIKCLNAKGFGRKGFYIPMAESVPPEQAIDDWREKNRERRRLLNQIYQESGLEWAVSPDPSK